MRKVFAIAAMGLLVLTLPVLAVVPAVNTDGNDNSPAPGPRTGPSGECPGVVLWDSGMYDEFDPAVYSCSSAGSAGCMVNADTTGTGPWPGDWGRRVMADDFLAIDDRPITAIKIWGRNTPADIELGYSGDTPNGMLHGFCVQFYEAVKVLGNVYCPDGTLPGESFIGPKVGPAYYCTTWDYWWVTTGVVRNMAWCIHLPYPAFVPTPGKWYWVGVMPDFDFQFAPVANAYSQVFVRVFPGLGISQCEVQSWDGWNNGSAAMWTPVSDWVGLPCWDNWDMGFKLYSGELPVATEPTTWGRIKANYR